MVDGIVRATAARWVSDDFPGWIECEVVDTEGRSHRVVEKAPILRAEFIMASPNFPFELWLRARCDHVDGGTAVIQFRDGVTTTEGLNEVRVNLNAIRWD